MKNVRIRFKKTGSAKYISHLDLMRCMARALKISGLPVWHTEGYNPRIYMNFAMPLSLGVSGENEMMDFRVVEEIEPQSVPSRLQTGLPTDILVLSATEPVMGFEKICFAEYEITLSTGKPQELEKCIRDMLAGESIAVVKKGKRGDKRIDIKPYFEQLTLNTWDRGLRMNVTLPCAQQGSVNPSLFLDAIVWNEEGFSADICRKNLLSADREAVK